MAMAQTGNLEIQSATYLALLDQIARRDQRIGILQRKIAELQERQDAQSLLLSEATNVMVDRAELDNLIQERNALSEATNVMVDRAELDNLIQERNALTGDRDRLIADRDFLIGEIDRLNNQLSAVLSTRVWKLATTYWHIRDHIRQRVHRWMTFPYRLTQSIYRGIVPLSVRLELRYRRHPEERPKQLHDISTSHPVSGSDMLQGDNVEPTARGKYDVVIFSIIEFEARFQRPQQLAIHFAEQGHRVFYVSSAKFLPAQHSSAYSVSEIAPRVYEVVLKSSDHLAIYETIISEETQQQFLNGLRSLRDDLAIHSAISIVHLPFWTPLTLEARNLWEWRLVYDCMDEWDDFPHMHQAILDEERRLVKDSDIVTVTGQILFDKWSQFTDSCLLVRNGVDFDFFADTVQPNPLLSKYKHPIIGYYGAIAEWVDLDLVRFIAQQRPECEIVLLGDIFVDTTSIAPLPNVHLLGRQPYHEMPLYLYHFDVCIIPFKLNKITHAVDPVKFYEYISVGKPVVSVRLLELVYYQDCLYLAETPEEFLRQLDKALLENDTELMSRRIDLAIQNDWSRRVTTIDTQVTQTYPKASVIIVTYENAELTKACIESILRNTAYPHFEIIIVDNHSSDSTRIYLQHIARVEPRVKIILNMQNRGFAAANNQGIRVASGEFLILLNNDTIVPPGWLEGLLKHLQNPQFGLVGPVTNFCGNEARIIVPYESIDDMETFAAQRIREHDGQFFDIPMLAMFCVAMRKEIVDNIGLLDENFGTGMFEDDDYSKRVKQAGYRVVCAEDVFVHHFGQAAFKKLIETDQYQKLWEKNQAYFEQKWQESWQPHQKRQPQIK